MRGIRPSKNVHANPRHCYIRCYKFLSTMRTVTSEFALPMRRAYLKRDYRATVMRSASTSTTGSPLSRTKGDAIAADLFVEPVADPSTPVD